MQYFGNEDDVVSLLDSYFGSVILRTVDYKPELKKVVYAAKIRTMTAGPERLWVIVCIDSANFNPQLRECHLKDLAWTSLQYRVIKGCAYDKHISDQPFTPSRKLKLDQLIKLVHKSEKSSIYKFDNPHLPKIELLHDQRKHSSYQYPHCMKLDGALDTKKFIASV